MLFLEIWVYLSVLKKKLFAVLAGLLALHLCALAQTASEGTGGVFLQTLEAGLDSERYFQHSLMMVDPVGDAHLLRQIDTIPIKLFSYLFHGTIPQAEASARAATPPYKTGTTVPFDADRLINKCSAIMRSEFPDIFPTLGEEHKWSPEAEEFLPRVFWHRLGRHLSGKQRDFPMPTLMRTKLFICLACGWTARYCCTGQEKALKERVMTYPDRSVQIHDLFAESYVLNDGNLYLTFLTCENLLAGIPHRRERARDPVQKKLSYIRIDSEEYGDNYGAWYHFFGIALYALMRTDFESVFVADAESFGSFFLEGPDRQEDLINHYGALFGQKLRGLLDNGGWWLTSPADTAYMNVPQKH